MRVREGGERAAKGGCVFLSLQHQQRGEGHNQFHREEEEEKAQVDREERGKGRKELPEESSITVEVRGSLYDERNSLSFNGKRVGERAGERTN